MLLLATGGGAPLGGYRSRGQLGYTSWQMAILVGVMDESGRVVIVGGGILGTMHAVIARRRGLAVTHLEREQEGRGASVRNFGLVWVSGRRAGPELALALRARELWESIAADAPGTGFRPAGSLTIATTEAELAVMREAAELPDAKQREFELLAADERARGQPGAARGVPRRAVVPGRRDRRAAAGAARAAGLADRGAVPATSGGPGGEAVEVAAHGVRDQPGDLAPGRPRGAVHRRQLHRHRRAAPGRVRRARERAGGPGRQRGLRAGAAADAADAAVPRPADHLGR